jgi:hypothetical protein
MRKGFLLGMEHQVETFGQQALHHYKNLIYWGVGWGLSDDIDAKAPVPNPVGSGDWLSPPARTQSGCIHSA